MPAMRPAYEGGGEAGLELPYTYAADLYSKGVRAMERLRPGHGAAG